MTEIGLLKGAGPRLHRRRKSVTNALLDAPCADLCEDLTADRPSHEDPDLVGKA